MESEVRKIGFYAATGILIAVLIIAGVFLSGVQFPSIKIQTGTLLVLLTDAPVNLTHLNVTIDSFSVLNVEDGDETWINILKEEVYFDLLALENETMELSEKPIPVGNYTKMRMNIRTANATFANEEPVKTVNLTVPPGHIDIITHFEIESDDITVLLIDMQADWVAISKNNRLRPVLKASVSEPLP